MGNRPAVKKPRIIDLSIRADGREGFRVGGSLRRAKRLIIHVDLGGIAGVIAPVIENNQPTSKSGRQTMKCRPFSKWRGSIIKMALYGMQERLR